MVCLGRSGATVAGLHQPLRAGSPVSASHVFRQRGRLSRSLCFTLHSLGRVTAKRPGGWEKGLDSQLVGNRQTLSPPASRNSSAEHQAVTNWPSSS